MKLNTPLKAIFLFCLLLIGTLSLTACASRRSTPSYVFTSPDQIAAARSTPAEPEPEPRTRRFSRSRSSDSQTPRARAEEGMPIAVTPVAAPQSEVEEGGSRRSVFRRLISSDPEDAGQADLQPAGVPPLDDTLADEVAAEQMGGAEEPESVIAPGYRLRQGDQISVSLRGIPEPADYEFIIPDDGYIFMPYISPIQAKGLTISELQRLIHGRYIEEQIYRQLSVNVLLPTQHYFVRGEVRAPGRFPLTSGMTVLKAIAAAGGYTEFANPRRVEVIRAGETISGNARQMEQNPEEDFMVQAGDVIIVRRSIF